MTSRTALMNEAQAALRAAGLRATPQRAALYRALAAAKEPRSVEALRKAARGIDEATVYRILDAFIAADLARRIVPQGGDRALYEAAGPHHHHIVCDTCGAVEDVDVCVPAFIPTRALAASKKFRRVDRHELEFVGTCISCARS